MIESPLLIIGCPRSGTTLLYNILSEVPSLWSIGGESKAIIERFHSPATKGWESGALVASDLTDESRDYLMAAFQQQAAPGTFWRRVNSLRGRLRATQTWRGLKRYGQAPGSAAALSSAVPQQGMNAIRALVRARNAARLRRAEPIRLLEKTPENCLRLPFLLALFPDARIIFLTRDGRSNVSSLMEGWQQPHLFPGYQVPVPLAIPGYERPRWAFTLIPGWRDLTSRPLEEICARQWIRCNEAVLAFQAATRHRVPMLTVRYEDLVAEPGSSLARIARFADIEYERDLAHHADRLPQINVVSAPQGDKWRHLYPEAIQRILPLIQPMMQQLGYESSA